MHHERQGTFVRVFLKNTVHRTKGFESIKFKVRKDGRDDYFSIQKDWIVDHGLWKQIDEFQDLVVMETVGTIRLPKGVDLCGCEVVRAE